ncbi:hypothetical protein BJ742DRAFT_683281, partial [Cladochytrium replicatum]
GSLQILNQLLLPFESIYEDVLGVSDGHLAIKTMKVRGAPAIAIVAALSLAVELSQLQAHSSHITTAASAHNFIHSQLEYLKTSRPTAVNLFAAAGKLDALATKTAAEPNATGRSVVDAVVAAAEAMLDADIADNKNIGNFGAEFILKSVGGSESVKVLTHCNTGSLATAGWGTALGIVRQLHALHKLQHCYCTETRPYNHGSRLTAYELVYEKIPSTLVTDSMVSALLRKERIAAIVVGADRVASNGDTANKIGTYQLAITARHLGVLFIVSAPSTSVDLNIASGDDIPIEERAAIEVVQIRGQTVEDEAVAGGETTTTTVQIAANGIGVWNPAFDVSVCVAGVDSRS